MRSRAVTAFALASVLILATAPAVGAAPSGGFVSLSAFSNFVESTWSGSSCTGTTTPTSVTFVHTKLQVTADGTSNRATAAWTSAIDFSAVTSISVHFVVTFRNPDKGLLGDGVAFVFQQNGTSDVLGYFGGFLGYAHGAGYTQCGSLTSPTGFAVGISPYADKLYWGSGGVFDAGSTMTMDTGRYRVDLTLTRTSTSVTSWSYSASIGAVSRTGTVPWTPGTTTYLGFTGGTGGANMTSLISNFSLTAQ